MILLPESGMEDEMDGEKQDVDMPIDESLPETEETPEFEDTEQMPEDEDMDMVGGPLPIENKAIMEKDIQLGDQTFELFKDFDMHDGEFYYLVLPSGGKMLGFLANFQGDLIDLKGDTITPLVQLTKMLMDNDFNEYEGAANGILVRQIELAEIVPEEVIGGEVPEKVEDGEISDEMIGEETPEDLGEELPLPEGIAVPEEIDEGNM